MGPCLERSLRGTAKKVSGTLSAGSLECQRKTRIPWRTYPQITQIAQISLLRVDRSKSEDENLCNLCNLRIKGLVSREGE